VNYDDREYEWKIGHDISPAGHDYGYTLKRWIKGSGQSSGWGEMTREHLIELTNELIEALQKIEQGDL
jgi:hypothetical protein